MTVSPLRSLSPTPLHARTADLCSTNIWSSTGGFTVPGIYTSVREEQEALSARVGLSDLSARQCWRFEGPDAGAFLSFATTADVSSIEPGQTARVLWCDDYGFVRGEGVIARYGEMNYELATSVRDFSWFYDAARGFDLKVSNVTGQLAGIGVRGPFALLLLTAAGFASTRTSAPASASLSSASGATYAWKQSQVSLVKDANTDGFELWAQFDDAIVVWDRLMRVGSVFGVAAVGSVVLESARIEAALPMAEVDWIPAQMARSDRDLRVPAELGLHLTQPRRYNGSIGALARSGHVTHRLAQVVSRDKLTHGDVVVKSGTIGRISSCVYSDAGERWIAIAWLKHEHALAGSQATVPSGGSVISVQVVKPCYS